jgi:DNA-binding response OmpR family regulator
MGRTMPRTILVIDDEPELRKLLDYNLSKAGYLVLTAAEGQEGLALARRQVPDLILLDVMMPGLDGLETCKRLRADPATASVPLIMLTAKGEEGDRVLGLELGADDYVAKPFGVRELVARVKALLRRSEGVHASSEVLRSGKIVVDVGRHLVNAAGKIVELTSTEFKLLQALAQRPGRVFSRESLLSEARGDDATSMDRTIDVHMVSLRRKLGKAGEAIETVRGVGYRLKE